MGDAAAAVPSRVFAKHRCLRAWPNSKAPNRVHSCTRRIYLVLCVCLVPRLSAHARLSVRRWHCSRHNVGSAMGSRSRSLSDLHALAAAGWVATTPRRVASVHACTQTRTELTTRHRTVLCTPRNQPVQRSLCCAGVLRACMPLRLARKLCMVMITRRNRCSSDRCDHDTGGKRARTTSARPRRAPRSYSQR